MTTRNEYTRRDLALAYINAIDRMSLRDTDPESLAARLHTFHRELLRGLKQLFDVDLNSDQKINFIFHSTAHSYHSLRSPLSGLIEGAGMLHDRVEGSGVWETIEELGDMRRRAETMHVDIVEKLLHLIKPDTGETFTGEDLKAIGVDDEEPTDPDFEWY